MTPYVTHNNEIGVRLSFLLQDEDRRHTRSLQLFTWNSYKHYVKTTPSLRLREGYGKEILLRWEAMPTEWREKLIAQEGEPKPKAILVLEGLYRHDHEAQKVFEDFIWEDTESHLTPDQIRNYTLTSGLLKAVDALRVEREVTRKRSGINSRDSWQSVVNDFLEYIPVFRKQYNFLYKVPTNNRRLREALFGSKSKPGFKRDGAYDYTYLIDGRARNMAAAKVKDEQQKALVEELLRKHQNFDNEEISSLYNIAANRLGWKLISASTVANYRKAYDLYVYSGQRGETNFRHNKAMQVKRKAPSVAMAFWTVDGWDAELVFQKFDDGRTTYHNRLTVVVVLDPVANIKYPVGYAIGTHETPELITAALRDAANHTRELFGERYHPVQLQSDRYALSALTDTYKAVSKYFTPARARNHKSKVIEPYFLHLNKKCKLYFGDNWSGYGVTANKESQPNEDYLNKVRHSFPDEAGCRAQISQILEQERKDKLNAYMERWNALPQEDRQALTNEKYLYFFGQTHSHTVKLRGDGLTPTILGQSLTFDSFDPRFRECAFMDWAIKYDPQDLSSILVLNAKTDKGTSRLKEVVGTYRFELTEKYVQPMALYDRKEGDATELARVQQYNKQLEQAVVERGAEKRQIVEQIFIRNPELNDTLTKFVITDSSGQHKDQKSKQRLAAKAKKELPPAPPAAPEDFEIIDDVRNQY